MPSASKSNLYKRAGITNPAEFYRHKFVSDEVLDARYFRPLDRFDLRYARTMWVYDNVRAGASVLDLGCGAGMLALLRRKNISLVGIDLSPDCVLAARRNGYDAGFVAEISNLPLPTASFDYVVSLDVMGHVEAEEKDAVLAEIRRVLRPGGVTLHGIECTDRQSQKTYDEMSPEELARFIEIDGHVGLEEEAEHAARFRRFFPYVAWEPRYTLCLSSAEFIKQADKYGLDFEADFLEYLRGLSFKERRAFDIAMGYVFNKISDLHIKLPPAGLYTFLKASDEPLGPFYNEHRDRQALIGYESSNSTKGASCLDRASQAVFDEGWYEPNILPPVARWMGSRARIRFQSPELSAISLDLTTHIPELREQPVGLEFLLNGYKLSSLSLLSYGWLNLKLPVPEGLPPANGDFEFEIRAARTWQPRPTSDETRDDRGLSIAVCNIEIHP